MFLNGTFKRGEMIWKHGTLEGVPFGRILEGDVTVVQVEIKRENY